jgi:O-antigen/teichoic acid export membrane protein
VLWIGQAMLARRLDGLEQVGVYAVAARWSTMALFFPATMSSVLLPMFGRLRAADRHADARGLFWRHGALTAAFSTAVAAAVVVFAEPLMRLQGNEYAVGEPIVMILGLVIVPSAINNVLGHRAVAEGRLRLWVWSDIVLAAALSVGALLLVPVMGGVGLAWSSLIAYVLTCLVLTPVVTAASKRVKEAQ